MKNSDLKKAEKNYNEVVEKAQSHLDKLTALSEKIIQKGDTPSTCQKINIISSIQKLEYKLNGLCVEDFLN